MSRLILRAAGAAAFLFALTGAASAAETPKADRMRIYLVYEDNARMSKELLPSRDQIVANDLTNGMSVQAIVDVFATGTPNTDYEPGTHLVVWATDMLDANIKVLREQYWPINFMGPKGQITRTVVINHNCGSFVVNARIDSGGKSSKPIQRTVNLTCGD